VEKGIKLIAALHCDRQNEKLKFNQANEKNQLKGVVDSNYRCSHFRQASFFIKFIWGNLSLSRGKSFT